MNTALQAIRAIPGTCGLLLLQADSIVPSGYTRNQLRQFCRDLPTMNRRVVEAFDGPPHLAGDLTNALDYARRDALRMIRWAVAEWKRIRKDRENPMSPSVALRQAQEEQYVYQQAIVDSCNRADEAARLACTDADEIAAEIAARYAEEDAALRAEEDRAVPKQTLGPAPKTTQPPSTPIVRDELTEARDKWIYDECRKGTPYDSIARNLPKTNRGWYPIKTKQGVLAAAQRYAKRHGLPPPPRRQDR